MMEHAIRDFPKQFLFHPSVEREDKLRSMRRVIISGMGGSHLAADILRAALPQIDIMVHRDYGLPPLSSHEKNEVLFIASSYSGNTEEVIDGLEEARKYQLPSAVISVGGRLQELAETYQLPYIQLPHTGIQPRSALGFSLIALMKMMGMLDDHRKEIEILAEKLEAKDIEEEGLRLAHSMTGKVPIIYASSRNETMAYNWKIKCNETGKIPAFYNVFPELNHNEMTGFDREGNTAVLSDTFHVLFLEDAEDDARITKRMRICKDMYADRGVQTSSCSVEGVSRWERIFRTLLIADWCAYTMGQTLGVETEEVPMVEDFKKRMRESI